MDDQERTAKIDELRKAAAHLHAVSENEKYGIYSPEYEQAKARHAKLCKELGYL